jgi:hypothetical protein
MLGMSQVGRVVTGISLKKAFPGAVLPGMENLWEHSAELALALFAEYAVESHNGFDRTYDWIAWGDAAKDHFDISDTEFEAMVDDVLEVLAEANTV